MNPLAIYIHVPFCRRRCSYCHFDIKVFHPETLRQGGRARFVQQYLDHLFKEIAHYGQQQRPICSVFLGGGTPSQLDAGAIAEIMSRLRAHFLFDADCEISMEANPEDVSVQWLEGIANAGVNRISFGVQSFQEPCLKAIGRAHTGLQARQALQMAEGLFPKGRSLDFILGLPFQTPALLVADLEQIQALAPEHLSLYMLEQDLPTPLDKKSVPIPDEDAQAEAYERVHDHLSRLGYDHYEISNFAKPGYSCRHNNVYWQFGDYLGLGPAAHGRLGDQYYANHPQLKHWQLAVAETGHGVDVAETWTKEAIRKASLMQAMRLTEGVEKERLNDEETQKCLELETMGLFTAHPSRWQLSLKGRLLANEVFAIFVDSD